MTKRSEILTHGDAIQYLQDFDPTSVMTPSLTRHDMRVYQILIERTARLKISSTYDELTMETKSNKSKVKTSIDRLIKNGYVAKAYGLHRCFMLTMKSP